MKTGCILALDLARRLGWAAGVPGDRPRSGVVQLRGQSHGEVYAALGNWLDDARLVHQPASLVYEAPLIGGQHSGINAARLALGMVAIVEQFCWDNSIDCLEEHVSRTRKEVLGRGSFPKGTAKAEVMAWVRAQGFDVADDNQADSIVLWLHAESIALKRPAGAIFQTERPSLPGGPPRLPAPDVERLAPEARITFPGTDKGRAA